MNRLLTSPSIIPILILVLAASAPGWFYKTYGAEIGADFQRQLA